MLPVSGAREEDGWRGSSKSLRSAGGAAREVSGRYCLRDGVRGREGDLTIIGIYHVIVLKGRLLVVVSPACGSHCLWGLRCTMKGALRSEFVW